MYLERGSAGCAQQPSACPTNWTQVDLGADVADVGTNCRRTCARTDLACLVIKLERTDLTGAANPCVPAPAPACPAGWTSADVGRVDKFFANCTRTCFFCP